MMKILFLLLLLLLVGCSDKVSVEDYQSNLINYRNAGALECSKHGQNFVMIRSADLKTYEAVCYQESPFRFFEYKLE